MIIGPHEPARRAARGPTEEAHEVQTQLGVIIEQVDEVCGEAVLRRSWRPDDEDLHGVMRLARQMTGFRGRAASMARSVLPRVCGHNDYSMR
jgi:hypothetical protein